MAVPMMTLVKSGFSVATFSIATPLNLTDDRKPSPSNNFTIAHQLCTQLGALKDIETLELGMKN